MYRIGFLGWKLAARLGVPLLLRIDVLRDSDAGVLVATSPDLQGLVVEARTADELMHSVFDCVDMLLETTLNRPLKSRPFAAWSGEAFV